MMKKIIALFFLFWVSAKLMAQKSNWTKAEDGKFMYYEVVADSTLVSAEMPKKLTAFFSDKDIQKISISDALVLGKGSFLVNKSSGAISHPAAAVAYQMQIEWKADKYRFWLTDFMLTGYQRDRYGNFVPTKLSAKPLETAPGKLNRGQWNAYIEQVETKAAVLANQLKKYLAEQKLSPANTDIKRQKDW